MTRAMGFHIGAVLILIGMAIAMVLRWPLPDLGFRVAFETGIVEHVQAGTAAARAGMQPGDQITVIYGYPWVEVNQRLFIVPLPWHNDDSTPITMTRAGVPTQLTLYPGPPDPALQIEKICRSILAVACWLTGYLLGTSPRASDPRLRRIAWFWLMMGGSLALYQLFVVTSYLMTIGVLWLQCTILAPIAVAMHSWYPRRPLAPTTERRTWLLLLGAVVILQVVVGVVFVRTPTTVLRYLRFQAIAPIGFLLAFLLSAVVLWRAYHHSPIAHIRRQIRLIATACVLAACWWGLLLVIQPERQTWSTTVQAGIFSLSAGLVPLAYLLGGVSADLMRLDQIARRIVVHALTGLLILAALLFGMRTQLLVMTPAAAILLGLALYRPLAQVAQRMVVGQVEAAHYLPLRQAISALGTSLHADRLATIIADGVDATFHAPLALYLRPTLRSEELTVMVLRGLDVPSTITLPAHRTPMRRPSTVSLASSIQAQFSATPLEPQLTTLVFHPGIALWGVIRHQKGQLLGLLVIGPRGDVDPYQPRDLQELDQLLAAASLALTNSASYTEQIAAKRMIRQLYRHLQQIEEQTAAAIAREIHDEVLNVNLRLNIELLQRMVDQVSDPKLRAQLETVIDGEQSTGQLLRLIGEELQPTGIDDPMGLTVGIERLVEQTRSRWPGTVSFTIAHGPVPVEGQVQRELVRIVREALTNAVTHAQATTIAVQICFPVAPDQPLIIQVCDNGQAGTPIAARPGHLGLRSMQERATSIGGRVTWQARPTGGTAVLIQAPTQVVVDADSELWKDLDDLADDMFPNGADA